MTLPFVFDVPAQFTPLDLSAHRADRVERTTRQIAQVWPDSADQRVALTTAQEVMIQRLRSTGVPVRRDGPGTPPDPRPVSSRSACTASTSPTR